MPNTNSQIDTHLTASEAAVALLERDVAAGNKGPVVLQAIATLKASNSGMRKELGITSAPAKPVAKQGAPSKAYTAIYAKDGKTITGWK